MPVGHPLRLLNFSYLVMKYSAMLLRCLSAYLLGAICLFYAPLRSQTAEADSLLGLLDTALPDSQRTDVLADLSKALVYQNPSQSLIYAKEAFALAVSELDTGRMIVATRRIGHGFSNLGELDSTEAAWRRALGYRLGQQDSAGIAASYGDLGNLFDRRGMADSAIYFFERALELHERHGTEVEAAIVKNNLGIVWEKQGSYLRALAYYLQALESFDALGYEAYTGFVFANLGNVYLLQRDYETAKGYYLKSLAIKRKTEDSYGIAVNYNNLGGLFDQIEQFDSSLYYHQLALDLRQEIGDQFGQSVSLLNIGINYFNLEQYDEALKYQLQAYQIGEDMGYQSDQVKTAMHLGHTYLKLGKLDQAEKYFLETLERSQEAGELESRNGAYKGLYQLYKARGDAKAFDYVEKHVALEDSLRNDEQKQAITRLEMEYHFDREKEILELEQLRKEEILRNEVNRQRLLRNTFLGALIAGLLILFLLWRSYQQKRKSNRILQEQKQTIEQTLEEREILLKEIHHRVKNNLQVVSSLLSLQSRTINDPAALNAIEEGRNRVKAMALIHKNLYQEGNLVGVDVPEYMAKLTDSLMNSYQVDPERVQMIRQVDAIALDVNVLIPLGLILNELISNALKHAFPDQAEGRIELQISEIAEGLEVLVADDGIGMKEGMDIQKSDSMGFKLVRSFVTKMKAQMKVQSEEGTRIRILIPKPYL